MLCSSCGQDNREGRRFCSQCGASLALNCTSCGAPNEPGWSVRVVPNRFAALTPEGDTERSALDGFFLRMEGVGYHEVVVETPRHDRFLHLMEPSEVEGILLAYRDRYLALRQDRRVKLILIFKNRWPHTRN